MENEIWTKKEKIMWKPVESCTREELIQKIRILEAIISGYQKKEIENDANAKAAAG